MKRYRHIGIYLKFASLVCGLLFFACTQDEEIASSKVVKSDIVTFGIGTSNEWKPDVIEGESRSRTLALPMDCEDGSLPESEIYMYLMEEDCPDEVDTVSVNSRAGENDNVVNIGIYAFQVPGDDAETPPTYNPTADGVTLFMDNVNIEEYTGNNVKYWPGGGSWLQFYAYQPYCASVAGLTINATGFNPTFTYTVPTTVTEQSDLMVGSDGMHYGNHCQEVQLELSHILSKIQVKVGNIPSGVVKSISFENIYGKGTYPFVEKKWEIDEENKITFEQENLNASQGEIGKPFHLLPQILSDEAMIKIVMEVTTPNPNATGDNDKERTDTYTLTKKLNDFKNEWKQDKQYTYVITTPQQVDVEVTDKVEGRVKKDLVIKNTGMSPAYIRAAIIGNWVQFDDTNFSLTNQNGEEIIDRKKIVAEWKESDGVFDWGLGEGVEHTPIDYMTNISKCWVKDNDGYFYYTGIVQPGDVTPKLFETYTLTASAPMAGAYLELIVAVQAVYPDDVSLLWKTEIVNYLRNLEVSNLDE